MKWSPALEVELKRVATLRALSSSDRGGWARVGREMLAAIKELERLRAERETLLQTCDNLDGQRNRAKDRADLAEARLREVVEVLERMDVVGCSLRHYALGQVKAVAMIAEWDKIHSAAVAFFPAPAGVSSQPAAAPPEEKP